MRFASGGNRFSLAIVTSSSVSFGLRSPVRYFVKRYAPRSRPSAIVRRRVSSPSGSATTSVFAFSAFAMRVAFAANERTSAGIGTVRQAGTSAQTKNGTPASKFSATRTAPSGPTRASDGRLSAISAAGKFAPAT